jgi:tricorn protease
MNRYLMYPDIDGDLIVFVNDNDLWKYNLKSRVAERMTNNLGIVTFPRISPDHKFIYFRLMTGKSADSSDIYSIEIKTGKLERITYLSGKSVSRRMYTSIAGFDNENKLIVSTDAYYPFGTPMLYKIENHNLYPLNLGPALNIIYFKDNIYIGRNTIDMPHWKHYKGGTRGKILSGKNGIFKIIVDLESNVNCPMIYNGNLCFISDHEGSANLYSMSSTGEMKKITDFSDYYVRNANSDGNSIIFQKAGSLFLIRDGNITELKIEINIPSTNNEIRTIKATEYLTGYSLDYSGEMLSLTTRGQVLYTGIKGGPVFNLNKLKNQMAIFSGSDLIVYNYREYEDLISIYGFKGENKGNFHFNQGIIVNVKASPDGKRIAIANNRFELFILNLEDGKIEKIDESPSDSLNDYSWSNDSRLLAYSFPESSYFGYNGSSYIKIYDTKNGKWYRCTTSGSVDFKPIFSKKDDYLYYLSKRSLDPVMDQLVFNLGYPAITKPFAVSLKGNNTPMFSNIPELLEGNKENDYLLDDITRFSQVFPVEAMDYTDIYPVDNGVLLLHFPVEGAMKSYLFNDGERIGNLQLFNFKNNKVETFEDSTVSFCASGNGKYLMIRKPGNKFIKKEITTNKNEDVNIDRFTLAVNPLEEWENMLYDAYRLIKENFWNAEKLKIIGDEPYIKYKKLLYKVTCRFELSDILREMQGEYATSHSYEIGGDLSWIEAKRIGKLGIDYSYKDGKYIITKIYYGDLSNENEKSPLLFTGIKENDVLKSINGIVLNKDYNPDRALINHSEEIIRIEVQSGSETREYFIKPLNDEKYLRYRNFVESNREYVHKVTDEKVGYVHIPDMGMNGYNEFFRLYDRESNRDALIVDFRFNGGGFVSQLLLEKIARKRIGYDVPRRGIVTPYPVDSVNGPLVALTNEYAGSDGDIGTHVFKLMHLGKVIGTRTWGGVVGINPKIKLLDGTTVTQPQFATWFSDVKYGLENYGTEPDILIEYMPQDFLSNRDPQLEKAIEVALEEIKKYKKLNLND